MNNLKIIIVDDEPAARKTIKLLINKISSDHIIVDEIQSVKEAIEKLPGLHFDLILLDIELIDGTGFDILSHFPNLGSKVVFTTAFDTYAIKAFKENAIDYLLKPISLNELKNVLKKCESKIVGAYDYNQLLNSLKLDLLGAKVPIKSSGKTEFVNSKEIEYVRAEGSYCVIHLFSGRKITSTKSLKHYENVLDSNNFFKINRNEVINFDRISLCKTNLGQTLVVMKDGETLKVSRRKKTEFNGWINK